MALDNSKRNIRSLMSRIRAYERFFKEQEKAEGKKKKEDKGCSEPSNQAHTAYMNLIKLVHALDKDKKDNTKEDAGVTEMLTTERIREVLRDVYGI